MATTSPTYNEDEREERDDEDEELYKEFNAYTSLSPKEKQELVTKLNDMFVYALDHPTWTNGRERMIKCFQYKEGEQWTAEELSILRKRKQPDTVNNQISVVVNKLVGDLINQRVRVGYRGRNAPQEAAPQPQQPGLPPGMAAPQQPAPPSDDEVADTLTNIFLYIKQQNDLEFEERDMADDGFTCGFGVLEVYVTFDDMAQPEIKVRHEDPLIVYPDPDSRRYDWNEDARFVARARWVNLDEAVEMYPQAEKELKSVLAGTATNGDDSPGGQLASVDAFMGEQYIDRVRNRVRLIEVEYKKTERENLLLLGDGRSIPFEDVKEVKELVKEAKQNGMEYRFLDRLKHNICLGVYAAGTLLEHSVTDHKYYRLVPYFAFRRKTGEPYSLVTLALSMQDAVNKRESKALHLLNTNQAIYDRSAVDDPI